MGGLPSAGHALRARPLPPGAVTGLPTALVVTHTASEHPGLLGTWLPEVGLRLEVVEPWRGDELPESLDGFAALVVLGGPQQAYDDGSAPWLRATKELMRR